MSQNQYDNNRTYSPYEEDNEEEGIISKTGTFLSSLFYKVVNSINPFKSRKYVQNPYDIDSSNDPCKHLNYVDTINNNNNLFISSSFPNYNNNININDSKEQNKNKTNQINLGNSNYEEFPNDPNNNYFTVEDLCNASPTLKPEIYKDIQRPNYIPNEEYFQKAKKYVYDNIVKQYRIMKPKINDTLFGESVILLAIQLTNKYNIEKHYDYLVNKKLECFYKVDLDVPEIIKNYYGNKAKVLFYQDLNENSEEVSRSINKELLNRFSSGIFFNDKEKQLKKNDKIENNKEEKSLICRTPRTKRNYMTCLFEQNFNYDYLCPSDKVKCQIYKECLLHKENEIKNYARIVETTNNMFKHICNENEQLRETVKEKDEKIEEYSKQRIIDKIKEKEKDQKLKDYENEIERLKNIINNSSFEISQNKNINNPINENINILIPNQSENHNIINNLNSKSSIFTLKKQPESQSYISFGSQNDKVGSEKTATFNISNKINNSLFSNSNKNNNNESNLSLILKSQSNDKDNNNFLVNEEKESDQKIDSNKLFKFIQTGEKEEEKKEKNEDKFDNNIKEKKEEKNEINIFSINNNDNSNEQNNNKLNFGFVEKNKEEQNNNKDKNEITKNEENNNKIVFGFVSDNNKEGNNKEEIENKKENKNIEEKQKDDKADIIEKTNVSKGDKNEGNSNNINIFIQEQKEKKIEEKKEQNIYIQKESLNNPNNPFLSAANIKTNEEFSTKFLNEGKDNDNNMNDISERNSNRNTMDNTNNFIKFGDSSNIENSNSNLLNIPTNNFLSIENRDKNQSNPFIQVHKSILEDNNNSNDTNPFLYHNNNQKDIGSNNIFTNNNLNSTESLKISNFNNTNNFMSKLVNNDINNNNNTTNNPFLSNNKINLENNTNINKSNNPFLNFNNDNNANNNISMTQNPFGNQNKTEISSSFLNNNNETKPNNNPFITTLSNSILNVTNNNNYSINNQNNNPFVNNNNNNEALNTNTIINSNNPFLTNNNNSISQSFNQSTFNDNSSSNNTNTLFNFKINDQGESNRVNPFLENNNKGFNFNNSSSSFALGVNLKKPGGNNYTSIFDDNKSRKINGFFN